RAQREPRPPRWRDVPEAGRAAHRTAQAVTVRVWPMEEPRERPAGGAGTHPVVDDGRGNADPGRGPGSRHDSPHDQPPAQRGQLRAAFAALTFLVAVDFYINEPPRFAQVILPPASPAAQPNYEFGLYPLSVRNVVKWSSPAPASAEAPEAWQVLARLSGILMG